MKFDDLELQMIKENCNVMAMFKWNIEIKDNKFTFEDLGDFERVDSEKIKLEIAKSNFGSCLLADWTDIRINTGKTKISAYYYNKAIKILDTLDQSVDFEIYESVECGKPIFLINEDNTAFVIAPIVDNGEEDGK